MLRWIGPLIVGIGLGAGAFWIYDAKWRTNFSAEASEADGKNGDPGDGPSAKRAVFGLGTLQPKDGNVLVTSTLVGTLIDSVPVREGQWVEKGELLVLLDSTIAEQEVRVAEGQQRQASERQRAEMLAAQQRVEATKLALEQAQKAQKSDPAASRKQLEAAQSKVDQTRSELNRQESQARTNPQAVPAPVLEQQRGALKLAELERDAAESALARLEQALSFAVQKAEAEKKAAEQSLVVAEQSNVAAAAQEQVRLAAQKIKECTLAAPAAGTVLKIEAKPGERVSTMPLLELANLKTLCCEAEIDVADVPLVRDRREAFLTSQAFRGARVAATIERIGNTVGAATLRPVDPRKAVDRTVATVVLAVDAGEARRLVGTGGANGTVLMGLQVDVEIPLAAGSK